MDQHFLSTDPLLSFRRSGRGTIVFHIRHRQDPTTGEADPIQHVPSCLYILQVSLQVLVVTAIDHRRRDKLHMECFCLRRNDPECKNLLEPVLNHCDSTTCARNECMEALQHFYKTANHKHSVEIAFCLCRLIEQTQ